MKKQWRTLTLFSLALPAGVLLFISNICHADLKRTKYEANGQYLIMEWLRDDLVHFEYGVGHGPDTFLPIQTSPMVCDAMDPALRAAQSCRNKFKGAQVTLLPSNFMREPRETIESGSLRIEIQNSDLSIRIIDRTQGDQELTRITPFNLNQGWKGLSATRKRRSSFYGLGQKFLDPMKNDSTFDWNGRVREGGPFGNAMEYFNGGMNANTQIPVLYVQGETSRENYGLFLDNIYKQRWDFTADQNWQVEMNGEQIRFFVMAGPDLLHLRKAFLDITGYPLVPPKKAFGLWMSEYSYRSWNHVDEKLFSLRSNRFPVDGFVLDGTWFGGINSCSDSTQMGSMSWDTTHFPNAPKKIAELKSREGVGIMVIEEPYVGRALSQHAELQSRGCLVKSCAGCSDPLYIDDPCWWGKGGMIDYTSDSCGEYIHSNKRMRLVADGVWGHWLDLGEPELYRSYAGYAAGSHFDIHNLYNFNWIRSIFNGYFDDRLQQRPFILTRSGAAGIQRMGTAVWSGDTASRLSSLVAQSANQASMSLSGIDYYGSDIGGFRGETLDGDRNDLYTQWYAYGSLFEVPIRPHTDNIRCSPDNPSQCTETAPDRIGDQNSNRENTRLRYELAPYFYSLAHRAYLYGEPVLPPPVLHFQEDGQLRGMAHEKMIGKDLLAAIVAGYGETHRDVYLPAGKWFDYHSLKSFLSQGQWLRHVPEFRDGRFALPLFAREGAIIPLALVNDQTMNILGQRLDGKMNTDLIVRVFPGQQERSFTLYEDDGETTAYQSGQVRTTVISQRSDSRQASVLVRKSNGTYTNAPTSRNVMVRLVTERPISEVRLNGRVLPKQTDLSNSDWGWVQAGPNEVIAKSGVVTVGMDQEFSFGF